MSARRLLSLALALPLLLAACAGSGERGLRPTVYDFGPGTAQAAAPQVVSGQPPLVLANVETSTALDGNAVLYRLAYADAQQLRPYALARWSTTPAQLLQQRLREHLGAQRVVLAPGDSVAGAARSGGDPGPRTLRITLEEFSQVFDSPGSSSGLLRLRATLLQSTPSGDRLLAQRGFVLRQPAPSPDAPGGVRALTAAADAAAQQLADWLAQQP
jgi:cholesterol transport system auxiliary component